MTPASPLPSLKQPGASSASSRSLQLPPPTPSALPRSLARSRSSRHETDQSGVEWSTFTPAPSRRHPANCPIHRHSPIIRSRSNSKDEIGSKGVSLICLNLPRSPPPPRGVSFDRDVARLLMLSPRPSSDNVRRPQPRGGGCLAWAARVGRACDRPAFFSDYSSTHSPS